jgi:hypothetical protein
MRAAWLLALIGLGPGVGMTHAQQPDALPPPVTEAPARVAMPAQAEPPVAAVPVDQGFPAPWASSGGGRLWAEADYIVYWLKPVCLTVPTISSGSPTDQKPGVLGQAGTVLLQGDHKFEFGGASGIRPRFGAWLTADQFLGAEVEGFVLEQVAAGSPVVTNNGSPPTYLVYQNPDNSKGALPFTIPGVVTGTSSAVGSSHLWGLEGNLIAHIASQRGSWVIHVSGLAGWRYLQLNDRVFITNRQALVADPSVTAIGEANFATRNQFIGGQMGGRFGVVRGNLGVDLTTKLAFGETHLVSDVAGSPLPGASALPPLVPGPLLALPSNIGQLSSYRITVVPEVNLRLRWQVTQCICLTLGYNVLYWNKILCPGDQMDPHVNTSQLPFRGPPTGPAAPGLQFVFTDAFAHGLEAGVRFTY